MANFVNREAVKTLCLLQVFNWEVKATVPETVQLFSDFCAVRYSCINCPNFLLEE